MYPGMNYPPQQQQSMPQLTGNYYQGSGSNYWPSMGYNGQQKPFQSQPSMTFMPPYGGMPGMSGGMPGGMMGGMPGGMGGGMPGGMAGGMPGGMGGGMPGGMAGGLPPCMPQSIGGSIAPGMPPMFISSGGKAGGKPGAKK